jgi:hypothetical protein
MRKNTPKQSVASRKNGAKGKGPKSPAGRTAVRFNAVKDGIFSSEIVVESAGERPQDFERLRNEIWASIQPETTLEKMLATDVIENRWRLQRVRRAERLALIARVETWIQDELRQSEELNLLKAQFLNNYQEFLRLSTPQVGAEASEMKPKIEEIRSKLAASSKGLKFLIETMQKTEKQARSAPYLSWEWEVLILACCGFGDEVARLCIKLNSVNVQEAAKASKKQESEGGRDDKPNASKESKAGRTDSEDLMEKTIRLFRADEPKSDEAKVGTQIFRLKTHWKRL